MRTLSRRDATLLDLLRPLDSSGMSDLLRQLEALRPFLAEDFQLARRYLGPRLVVAMKTVDTRRPWGSVELSALPEEEQRDILHYLERQNMLPEGEARFAQAWNAHPHNYQRDPAQNISSERLRQSHGLPNICEDTCAVRFSVMLNGTGNHITPDLVRAAGIAHPPHYSEKTKEFYLTSTALMMLYLSRHFRGPDVVYPLRRDYPTADEFSRAFMDEIGPAVASRKGIVAFEGIFGYSGSGHVDLFDGMQLSGAATWYPCRRLHIWNLVVS